MFRVIWVILRKLMASVLALELHLWPSFVWKLIGVRDILSRHPTGEVAFLDSDSFTTGTAGYKMCARIYFTGSGPGLGTHLGVSFVIKEGEYDAVLPWPFRQKVTVILMDQEGDNHLTKEFSPAMYPTSAAFERPEGDVSPEYGEYRFCPIDVIRPGSPYVSEDALFLKVIVQPYSA